jgi:DNA-binding CsgD family transcriptional regulator
MIASAGHGSRVRNQSRDNPAMAVRISSPVFIGRSDELARFHEAIDRARAGQATALVVAGEAGVGKTRLLGAFGDAARNDGVLVLSGGCIDLGDGSVPYAPIVEALRRWVRRATPEERDSILGIGRSELARLVPDLASPDGETPDSGQDGLGIGSAQGRLFELVLGVFLRLAARGPLALVVEDIHWSDRSTRDLLAFLVRNIRDAGVILVCTYRSDELHRRHPLHPFLAELGRSDRVERLELRRFDRHELVSQLRAIAGPEVDPALVDSIHARSDGNPFFAEELLVSARESGATDLPPTLRDVLLARVAGLAEATQDVLRIASAAGQRVDPDLIAAVTSTDRTALYEALREAVTHHVLVPDATAGEERYAFRHALLQEAVYDDLLPGERTRLHSAFAKTLDEAREAGDTTRSSELAYHWYAAHDLPRAFEAAMTAAVAAEASYAFPEALVQYERALELWDRVPEAAANANLDRVDLLAAAASVARFNEPQRSIAHLREALDLVDAAADGVRAGLLHERLGRCAWIAGEGALALEAHRTAVRLIPVEPPSEARARALAGLAQITMLQRHYDESRGLAEEAIRLARAVGARQIEGHALTTLASTQVQFGEVETADANMLEALAIARSVDNVDDVGRAYANRVDVLAVAGRLEEALDLAREAVVAARELGILEMFGTHCLCNAADLLYQLGRWEECEAAVREAEDIGPTGINVILLREMRGRLAMAHGRFDDAAEHLRVARDFGARTADGQFIAPAHASLAELAIWQRRPDAAVKHAQDGLAALAHSPDIGLGQLYALGVRALADVVEMARGRRSSGDEASAVEAGQALHADLSLRHATVSTDQPLLRQVSGAWLALSEAELLRLGGTSDAAAWAAVAAGWEHLGRPYPTAYARYREAEAVLAGRGDRKRATAALTSVVEVATALGAEPLRREAEALAQRARLSLEDSPEVAESPPDDVARLGLTARELEVLRLVAVGRTNRQIGEELFISEKTAGVHVSNILGKLGVAGRGEAAAVAHRHGLTAVAGQSPDSGGVSA